MCITKVVEGRKPVNSLTIQEQRKSVLKRIKKAYALEVSGVSTTVDARKMRCNYDIYNCHLCTFFIKHCNLTYTAFWVAPRLIDSISISSEKLPAQELVLKFVVGDFLVSLLCVNPNIEPSCLFWYISPSWSRLKNFQQQLMTPRQLNPKIPPRPPPKKINNNIIKFRIVKWRCYLLFQESSYTEPAVDVTGKYKDRAEVR